MLYEDFYCARGEAENRIGEQFELFADRASSATMPGNQAHVVLSNGLAAAAGIDARPRHERRGHRRVIQITEAKSTKAANIADAARRDRTRNRATKPTESATKSPIELSINVVRLLLGCSLRSFSRLLLATRRCDLDPLARRLQRNGLGQTPEFGPHPLIQAGKS